MLPSKADIIAKLRREVLSLQGLKPALPNGNIGLGPIEAAFPNNIFPTGALHEFITDAAEDAAATYGFICVTLAPLMRSGATCLWIRESNKIFPPALNSFGIRADQIIFIDLKRDRDVLWAAEEALKCDGLAAVIFEIQNVGLLASRRLQLAIERSSVTGFAIRYRAQDVNPIASVARWRITAESSELKNGIPGLGFPRWQIELLRVRNGKPGCWVMEYTNGKLLPVDTRVPVPNPIPLRKIG